MLVAMAGLPASGKSAIAQILAPQLGAVVLDKDRVRACLFEGAVDYEREQDDLCVEIIYQVAGYHFKKRPRTPVILDGRTYSRRYQVEAVKHASERAGVELYFIECVCSPETARIRLQSDAGVHLAADRNFKLYQRSLDASEKLAEPGLLVDTDRYSPTEGARKALLYLRDQGV